MPADLTQPFTARMAREEVPWSTIRSRCRRLLPTVYVDRDTRVMPLLTARAADRRTA